MEYLAHYFVWALTIFGVANSFKLAALLQPMREYLQFKEIIRRDDNGAPIEAIGRKNQFLYKLVTCPMCFSFHLGWLSSILVWSPTGCEVVLPIRLVCDAFLGSISGWLLYVYTVEKQFNIK